MKCVIADRSVILDMIHADLISMGSDSFCNDWVTLRAKYMEHNPPKKKDSKPVSKKIPALRKKTGIIVFCTEFVENFKKTDAWLERSDLIATSPFDKVRLIRSDALVKWKTLAVTEQDVYKCKAEEMNIDILDIWRTSCSEIRILMDIRDDNIIRDKIGDKSAIRKMAKSEILEFIVLAGQENFITNYTKISDLRKILVQFHEGKKNE
jgi:hypothetical protein